MVKFAPVQNMPRSSLFLQLNFAPILGYFMSLRGEKMPCAAPGAAMVLPRSWIILY